LGYSIVCELARRGAKVAAIDSAPEQQESRDGSQISSYTADVAVEQQLAAVAQDVVERYGRVDLLVNNAAVSASVSFTCIPAEMFERIVRVNFLGVVNACRVFLPYLKRGSHSQILNVSSCFAWTGYPGKSAYAASKAAIRAFSECLRMELTPEGIGVTLLYPGPVRTGIVERGHSESPERKQNEAAFLSKHGLPADLVAARCLDRLQKNPARIIVGAQYRLIDLASRAVPSITQWAISKASARTGF
jgi:NAD(P)-dependent dehydrogenase (short-subunit alcohol dehydrogenase family)